MERCGILRLGHSPSLRMTGAMGLRFEHSFAALRISAGGSDAA